MIRSTNRIVCPKCCGKRHVYSAKRKRWTRCECLAAADRLHRMNEAGVPAAYRSKSAKDAMAESGCMAELSLPVDKPIAWWLRGSPTSGAFVAGWVYILIAAVDAELTAGRVSIVEAVDSRFDREARARYTAMLRRDVLVVDLAGVDHSLGQQELEHVYSHRATMPGLTLYTSAADVRRNPARFGRSIAAAFKAIRHFDAEDEA